MCVGLSRIPESIKYYCKKGEMKAGVSDGGCPVNKRDKDGYCLHTKFCSSKQEIKSCKAIIENKEDEKEIECEPKTTQQKTLF